MKPATTNAMIENLPWFRRWFDCAHYHKLYANRNEKEAQDFIDMLITELQPAEGCSMIDVGCGAGRHCKYLASKGFDVTGIDTAFSSIQLAKSSESASLRFYQYDMRNNFGTNKFDYVFNFFTSFGYFKTQSEHQQVVQNMSDALKPAGTLVIDYLNVGYAEDRIIAAEEKEIDGIIYYINRWMDDQHFYKKIAINDILPEKPFEYVEQVAKFTLEDFESIFALSHLKMEAVYGDYSLNGYDRRKSPRMIMVVKRNRI